MDDPTFEALFRLNRLAKEYAARASERYEYGDGGGARLDSIRKAALYDYKSAILTDLLDEDAIERVERHTIDGRDYYCLYLAGRNGSFHTPVEDWTREISVVETKTLTEFDANPTRDADDADRVDLSEREALTHLDAVFGYSANEFVGQEWIERFCWDYTGWSYLSGALELGTRVDDPDAEAYPDRFHFAVGDSFRTLDEGVCEIHDRYGALSRRDFGPPAVEARYDVCFGQGDDAGVVEEVSPDNLFRRRVLVDDPANLDVEFEGDLSTIIVSAPVEFSRGDHLTLDIPYEDDLVRVTVREFAVWDSLVDCLLEYPDGETEWLCVDDFEAAIIDVA